MLLHVVSSAQRRGAEIFLLDLVRALGRHRVSQHVAVLHQGVGPGIRFDAPTTFLRSQGPALPMVRVRPTAIRDLRSLISDLKPDIIQVHGGEALKNVLLADNWRGTAIVYRRIGMAHPQAVTGIRKITYALMMQRCTAIVAVAESVRAETIEVFGVPAKSVLTIPRGIDQQRLRPIRGRKESRSRLGIPNHAPVLLSLGSLTWEKDPLTHVEVTEHVVREMPEAFHLIAGDGPLRPRIQDAVRDRGIGANVRILGAREDVADLLAASDLVLLASRVEGMPGCIIEAGMAGIPAAAYAVAGVPEIVEHGVTGLLARQGDVTGLSRCVLQLLQDPISARAMGRTARKSYESKFTIAAIASRYLNLYENVRQQHRRHVGAISGAG